jgi:hypothetical protein
MDRNISPHLVNLEPYSERESINWWHHGKHRWSVLQPLIKTGFAPNTPMLANRIASTIDL